MGRCTCRARGGCSGIAWSVGGGVCFNVDDSIGCWAITLWAGEVMPVIEVVEVE